MNKTISLSAIAMFAVIMGMSAVATAMAIPPNEDSEATYGVCHQYSDGNWGVLYTSNAGQLNGHVNGHGDEVVDGEEEAYWCVFNNNGSVGDV